MVTVSPRRMPAINSVKRTCVRLWHDQRTSGTSGDTVVQRYATFTRSGQ